MKFTIVILSIAAMLNASYLKAQVPQIIDVATMQQLLLPAPGKVKVINYWATWCKPCVKELPLFLEAQKNFPEVEFVFISLDFAESANKVAAFAEKRGMKSVGLYIIDDLDYNSWIDKVSPEWSGAIPATLIVNENGKYFFEQEFTGKELSSLIQEKTKK